MAEAYEKPILSIPVDTAADMTAHIGKVILADGTLQTSAGAGGYGILVDAHSQAVSTDTVIAIGVARCIAGAAITAGARVSNDNAGLVVAATAGDVVIGIALQTAGNANEIIAVGVDFFAQGEVNS